MFATYLGTAKQVGDWNMEEGYKAPAANGHIVYTFFLEETRGMLQWT